MLKPNAKLLPTASQTIGPFFPQTFFREGDNDLTRVSAEAAPSRRGERILLRGVVRREGGVPCVNAILEAWQADASGRFRHPKDPETALADPDFLGWGRARTDAGGAYEFHTLLPGGFTDATGARAPHVELAVMASGLMRTLFTTVFFPDFPGPNAADPVLAAVPEARRALLVAQPDGEAAGCRAFRFDLQLRGGAETPFFVE
ncbi:protocatechuate 3,4-dioxygenase subunit alpha [Siccirubricoccus sp. KC 17139]|uniref:Protocatechuate 3,4-dioxygenase subunit alpha n=1 Tax=Siccirubricoccus soli TaxID=2899147 RepID=A0ABT1DB75_9PROT|nr:protocatechuate 3,4-dioxygenase subunit alpha [Siccirubricoccus soli]MCO6418480.1 protocatechuate 3,4-dioxygenase subunit alpha [Siccirubricoccus soli]MCP2684615.1 protocatechuate 3,4-dioxygenase subunit alpha [Siccirubricoccus soli]